MTNDWKMNFYHHGLRGKLDAIGWGLALIWIGLAILTNSEPGLTFLGLGVIALAMQGVRKLKGIVVEGFWIVVGLVFLIGGFWKTFDPAVSLWPIIIIAAGLVLLFSALINRRE